jgi:hypothetical protein
MHTAGPGKATAHAHFHEFPLLSLIDAAEGLFEWCYGMSAVAADVLDDIWAPRKPTARGLQES